MKKLFGYNEGTISPKGEVRTFHHTALPEISLTRFNMLLDLIYFSTKLKAFKGNLKFCVSIYKTKCHFPAEL